MLIRLQKHLADIGICSRRKAEELIMQGKVKVNNSTIDVMGLKIDPAIDKVEVVGQKSTSNQKIYLALNKPAGYISSTTSKQGRSIIELIPKKYGRLYPVGRLDKDSEGLIILTNDGELTNILTHPKYEHEKEYEVFVNKTLSEIGEEQFKTGMLIGEEKIQGVKIKKINNQKYNLILKEGKKRQIRKMFAKFGVGVLSLKRTRINKIKLKDLPLGKYKEIRKENII